MPHFIIEHSVGLDPEELIEAVQNAALESNLFDAQDIKVRAIASRDFYLGSGADDFVHVTSKVLVGRSADQKRLLATTILAALEDLEIHSTEITVEVNEMERDSYQKSLR